MVSVAGELYSLWYPAGNLSDCCPLVPSFPRLVSVFFSPCIFLTGFVFFYFHVSVVLAGSSHRPMSPVSTLVGTIKGDSMSVCFVVGGCGGCCGGSGVGSACVGGGHRGGGVDRLVGGVSGRGVRGGVGCLGGVGEADDVTSCDDCGGSSIFDAFSTFSGPALRRTDRWPGR